MSKIDNTNAGNALRVIGDDLSANNAHRTKDGSNGAAIDDRSRQAAKNVLDALGKVTTDGMDDSVAARIDNARRVATLMQTDQDSAAVNNHELELLNLVDDLTTNLSSGGGKVDQRLASQSDTVGAINAAAPRTGAGTLMKADDPSLPSDLREISKTQQINFIQDANPPVYLTSSTDRPPTFSMYDDKGKKMTLGDGAQAPKAPFALGLNNGQWLAVSASGSGIADSIVIKDPAHLPPETRVFDLNGADLGKVPERHDVKMDGVDQVQTFLKTHRKIYGPSGSISEQKGS